VGCHDGNGPAECVPTDSAEKASIGIGMLRRCDGLEESCILHVNIRARINDILIFICVPFPLELIWLLVAIGN
jgi:hypothetical protein